MAGTLVIILVLLIALSTLGLTVLEPNTTLVDCFWWSIVTLTTVGYGDITPSTLAGRFIGIVIMFFGIGILGMFTATIAGIFVKRHLKEERGMHSYNFENDFVPETVEWNEVMVYMADSLNYTFYAEARSNDLMTVHVDARGVDGSNLELEFSDVQMYYDDGQTPPASLAVLSAPGSVINTQLAIYDPGNDRSGPPSRTEYPTSFDITGDLPSLPGLALHPVYPNPFN